MPPKHVWDLERPLLPSGAHLEIELWVTEPMMLWAEAARHTHLLGIDTLPEITVLLFHRALRKQEIVFSDVPWQQELERNRFVSDENFLVEFEILSGLPISQPSDPLPLDHNVSQHSWQEEGKWAARFICPVY